MAKKVVCTKCHKENEISSLFCRSCGAKLDLGALQSEQFEKKERRDTPKLFKVLRIVIALVLLALVGVTFWPTAPLGDVGGDQEAQDAREKITAFSKALDENEKAQAELTEDEINAYLAALLRGQPGSGGSARELNVSDINLTIDAGETVVFVKAGLGPVPLTYMIYGKPSGGGGADFTFTPTRAYLGHLPLPGPGLNWAAGKVGAVFSGLEPERKVLDNADRLDVASRKIRLRFAGKE